MDGKLTESSSCSTLTSGASPDDCGCTNGSSPALQYCAASYLPSRFL